MNSCLARLYPGTGVADSKRERAFRRARFLYLSVCGFGGVWVCSFVRFVVMRVYSFVGLSVCGLVGFDLKNRKKVMQICSKIDAKINAQL